MMLGSLWINAKHVGPVDHEDPELAEPGEVLGEVSVDMSQAIFFVLFRVLSLPLPDLR